MTSNYAADILLSRRRIFGLWLASILIFSTLIGISFTSTADDENVYVDGYVRDALMGSTISGASIIIQDSENGTLNGTTSDNTGYFNLSIHAPMGGKLFVITVFHEDYLVNSSYIWLSPGNNQTRDIFLYRAQEKGSRVQGRILDAVTMNPMPNVGVAAVSDNYINTTSTDVSGNYSMILQSNQSYWIQVGEAGYETQREWGYFHWGDDLTFNFLMEPMNCTLKGYVENSDGPLGSAYVMVYRRDEYSSIEFQPEVNWTTGYFEINLSRGVWHVEMREDMHYTQTLTVLMLNGQTTWQNFTLGKLPSERATIQGYVVYYHNGSAVPWAGISARNKNESFNFWNMSNSTGWYNISVIPGEIIMEAYIQDYVPEDITVSVADGETRFLNLTIFDRTENGYLEGYVKVNGTGEEGVNIVVYYDWWQYWNMTDINGYYNISVPGGPLNILARKDGFSTASQEVNTTSFETTRLNLSIEPLNWSCELRGFINNSDGDPLEGTYVNIDYDSLGEDSETAVTDYTGFFQQMVPEGNASYFILAENHTYVTGEVDLPTDQIFWLNETLNPINREAKIICRLTNIYNNKPIKHVSLSISEQDLLWYEQVETDANGEFRTSVPSGFVRINFDAWENGFKEPGMYQDPNRMQFFLKPGETKWLNISLFPRERSSLLYGFVNDTGSNPIQGATVHAQYGDTIVTNETDVSGYYEIRLPGDHQTNLWVHAPGYQMDKGYTWVSSWMSIRYDWELKGSKAWIEGPITDSVADLDDDSFFDVLYVNVTVNITDFGNYKLRGSLLEGRTSHSTISSAEQGIGETTGIQIVPLAFKGELIRTSGKDGYFVDIELISQDTWRMLDSAQHFTAKYRHNEFDLPNAEIEIPVEQWLVDSDFDGLYNLLVINVTLNVSVAGDYVLMGVLDDIWGEEFEPEIIMLTLEAGIHEIQVSFEGTSIYNNHENLGSCLLALFEGMPQEGSYYIDYLYFYTPYEYDIFQYYIIDSFVSGYVTDINDIPIENIEVMLYNISSRYLNTTKTDAFGFYELGGWEGEWILVVDDYEEENLYQGNLSEISLAFGSNLNFDVRNISNILLDNIEVGLTFSDWNNTNLDWLLYLEGDNETIRFMIDVLEFGDGDGFVSEEEVDMIMGFIGGMGLPESSNDSFLVDTTWFDLDPSSETLDAGLVGSITSHDPIYFHMTGNYTANSPISGPGPYNLTMNCSYDDTFVQSVAENNATHIYYIAVPSGWGRTGNGSTLNTTISGADYITVDPQGDPDELDENLSEWVNITISSGQSPTYCSIKGNVTLFGSGQHSGVMVTVYDNFTQQEVASDPTSSSGFYEVLGLDPGTYDVVAHKAGYEDNRSNGHVILAGDILWLDFTLYSFPPGIDHEPITSAVMGETIDIYVEITEYGKIDEVLLYYKNVNSSTYFFTNMSKIASSSTYIGTIPAQSQVGNLYYYIWANDTKGNFALHPEDGNHTVFIYELDPPDILNVTAIPDPGEYPEAINVSCEIMDFTSVENVSLFIEKPDMSTFNSTMNHDLVTGRYYLNSSYSLLGTYNFTIWANDSFDNWNSYSGGFDVVDTISPTSYVESISPYWYSVSPVTVSAIADDSGIGIANVSLWYIYSTDNSSWGDWTFFGIDTTVSYQWDFDFPTGDGYYQFYSIANDSAGNSETNKVMAEAICGYDTSAPISSVDIIDPYWHKTSPLTITALASSSKSNIDDVELWYQYSVDNTSWGSWILYNSDSASPWSWNFDFPDGDGYYGFYSIASDILGNTEMASSSADAQCAFDTSPPSFSSFSAVPDPCELGRVLDIFTILLDPSGIGGAWIDLSFKGSQVGNFSMSNSGQNYWYLYTPSDIGTVDFIIWVVDNNGFWNFTTDSIPVQDTTSPSITSFLISPTSPEIGSTVRVSVNANDISGIDICTINITTPKGDFLLNESMTFDSGSGTYYHETEYEELGEYEIVIWARDENGLSTLLSDTVTTQDSFPPLANAGSNQQVTAGTEVTLNADLSTDNHDISNYSWEFNDNGLVRLYGVEVDYTFNAAGNFLITLTVRDFGGNSDTSTTWVNVSAVSGTGTITGTILDENGDPIKGATVYVEGAPYIENTTDSLGRYVLHDVPVGDQKIIVVKDGYRRSSQDVTVQQDQTTTADDISLSKSAKEEESPVGTYGAIGAAIAAIALIVLFLLMKKMKQAKAAKTLIDEVFFMYNDGRLIKHFTRRLKPDMDEDILSSMLVAVQDFVKDSFRDQEGILDEMKFGRFQVLLGRGKYIILATIVLGEELEPFRPQVQKCVKDIEEKYGDVLEEWDGEMSKLAGASKYIVDLIDGRYT